MDKPWLSPIKLTGAAGEVTGVAWCPTDFSKVEHFIAFPPAFLLLPIQWTDTLSFFFFLQLVTISDDSAVRVWRLAHRGIGATGEDIFLGKAERTHKDIGEFDQAVWKLNLKFAL